MDTPSTGKSRLDQINEVAEKLAILEPRVTLLIVSAITAGKAIAKLFKANGLDAGPFLEEVAKLEGELAGLRSDIQAYNDEFRPGDARTER